MVARQASEPAGVVMMARLLALLVLLMPPLWVAAQDAAAPAAAASRARVFEATVDLFRDYYWDPNHLDWDAWAGRYRESALRAEQRAAFDAVMRRMVAEVGDQHSRWLGLASMDPDELRAQAPGATLGLGLKLRFMRGVGFVIERVLPDTPAHDAGLMRGDVIEALGGVDLRSMSAGAAGQVLAGAVDAGLAGLGLRRGAQDARLVELSPRLLDAGMLEMMPYAAMLEPGVGFLYLPSFTLPGTGARAHELLRELEAAGARSFVIDLRGNLGGNLGELGIFLGAFLDGDWVRAVARGQEVWRASFSRGPGAGAARLVSAEGRLMRETNLPQPVLVRAPTAVLVDHLTNSAAEVAAAVLQARGLAKVVGTETGGNVEAVQAFGLPDGSSVLIAVANLELPDGTPLNLGIVPEVSARSDLEQLARGHDPVIASALGALAELPFTPGRWF